MFLNWISAIEEANVRKKNEQTNGIKKRSTFYLFFFHLFSRWTVLAPIYQYASDIPSIEGKKWALYAQCTLYPLVFASQKTAGTKLTANTMEKKEQKKTLRTVNNLFRYILKLMVNNEPISLNNTVFINLPRLFNKKILNIVYIMSNR